MIKAIVCVDQNWAIGKNNGLLFNIKKDAKFFRDTTIGKTVVCGYNTLLSFPGQQPLKNRNTIVLCPDGIEPAGCKVFHSFDLLLAYIKELAKTEDVFIIGGGMLYNSMNYYCDEVLVTKVNAIIPDATVWYPNLDKSTLKVCVYESPVQEESGLKFKFCTYKRKQLVTSYNFSSFEDLPALALD